MTLPGRTGSSPAYRYGFQGQEKDDELKGEGNSYDYGARMLDPRVGRWLSIDPKWRNFESITPYNFANNNPIKFIDRDGEDPIDFLTWLMFKAIPWVRDNYTSKGFAIKITSYKDISEQKKDQIMYKVGLVDGMLSTIDAADMLESQIEDFKDWLSSKPFEFDTFRQKSAEDLTNTIIGPTGIGIKKQAEQITSIIENYDKLDEYTKGQIDGVILSTLASILIPEAVNIRIPKLKIRLSLDFKVKFKTGKLYSGIPFPEFISTSNKYINKAIKNIVKGDGIPRTNPDGTQKIYSNREGFSGKNNREFTGALEWEAEGPAGSHYRILEKRTLNSDGTTTSEYAYSTDINYKNIHKFKPKNP